MNSRMADIHLVQQAASVAPAHAHYLKDAASTTLYLVDVAQVRSQMSRSLTDL